MFKFFFLILFLCHFSSAKRLIQTIDITPTEKEIQRLISQDIDENILSIECDKKEVIIQLKDSQNTIVNPIDRENNVYSLDNDEQHTLILTPSQQLTKNAKCYIYVEKVNKVKKDVSNTKKCFTVENNTVYENGTLSITPNESNLMPHKN